MSNTPTLRFGEFDKEWSEKRLRDISNQISYGLTVRPEYHKEGIPLISARELRGGVIDYAQAPKISKKSYDELSDKAKAKKGDIFLTKTGTIGLSAYVSLDMDFPVAITQNIAVIRIDNADYSHQFIMQTFKTNEFYKSAISRVNQSTIMDLQLQDIRKLELRFPSKPEQQKIATFLSAIDSSIEQLSQKEQLLRSYKKGVMQKIFSLEIRFTRDDGGVFEDWVEKRLGDTSTIIGGGTPETVKKEYWNGNIQWFTPTEIKSKFIFNSKRTITELGLKKSSAKILPKGTLLFSSRATVGDIGIAQQECTTNQGFQSFVVNADNNNEFIYHWIKQNKKEFLKRASGSTFLEISKKEIEKIKINLPSLPEQTKIANFLSSLDKQIAQVSKQLAEKKDFKKGLLQKMFV